MAETLRWWVNQWNDLKADGFAAKYATPFLLQLAMSEEVGGDAAKSQSELAIQVFRCGRVGIELAGPHPGIETVGESRLRYRKDRQEGRQGVVDLLAHTLEGEQIANAPVGTIVSDRGAPDVG